MLKKTTQLFVTITLTWFFIPAALAENGKFSFNVVCEKVSNSSQKILEPIKGEYYGSGHPNCIDRKDEFEVKKLKSLRIHERTMNHGEKIYWENLKKSLGPDTKIETPPRYEIYLELTSEQIPIFANWTNKHLKQRFALTVDETTGPISLLIIPITSGRLLLPVSSDKTTVEGIVNKIRRSVVVLNDK